MRTIHPDIDAIESYGRRRYERKTREMTQTDWNTLIRDFDSYHAYMGLIDANNPYTGKVTPYKTRYNYTGMTKDQAAAIRSIRHKNQKVQKHRIFAQQLVRCTLIHLYPEKATEINYATIILQPDFFTEIINKDLTRS